MYRKFLISGQIIEEYRYEKLNVLGSELPEGFCGDNRDREGIFQESNYRKRTKMRRDHVRQYACANFTSGDKFVTLTFADRDGLDVTDIRQCNREFKRFVQRMRRRFPDFKYLAVIEFQDKNGRGAVHYHMICNLPFVRKNQLMELWGNGFVKVNRIGHVDNVGAYIVKYMTSDTDDKRLCGQKGYLHSVGLVKPQEIASWRPGQREVYYAVTDALKNESPVYCRRYTSDYAGDVEYLQYNTKRKVDKEVQLDAEAGN